MRENKAKRKLLAGECIYGTFSNAICPEMIEMLGISGFDFIVIDSEHSSSSPETNRMLIMAGESRDVTMMTRIPNKMDSTVLRNLDVGAQGLLVPQVNSKEEAEAIVAASYYFPRGARGVTMPRSADYGVKVTPPQYFQHSNDNMLIAVQCENVACIPHLEEIASVPGIDVIFVGPMDLSQSLGIPGQLEADEVKSVAEKVLLTAKNAGKYAGIFAMSAEQAKKYEAMGFRYIIVASDLIFFGEACSKIASELAFTE